MVFQFVKATKKRGKARIAIDGPSGAGKTFTGLTLATALAQMEGGKIAVVDTERGSASLYSDKFEFDVLELDSFSPAVYAQAIEAAEAAGYAVIVLDSLSHAWEGEGGALDMVDKAATRMQGNGFAAWKDVTPMHRRMVDAILGSKAHIVATMRSKMDYVQEKNENGKTVIRKVGMNPIQRQGMEYEFTLVADMDVDHHISISKSRCDAMTDKVASKPDARFWKPFVDWLNSGETAPAPAPAAPTFAPPAKPAPAPAPTAQPEPPKANGTMTYAEACAVENRDKVRYGDIETEKLRHMATALGKLDSRTPEQEDKLLAIQIIIAERNRNQ